MPTSQECPAAWLLPFTIADQSVVDALGERERDAVERYHRADASASRADISRMAEEFADRVDLEREIRRAIEQVFRDRA